MPDQSAAQYLYGVIHHDTTLPSLPPGVHGREVGLIVEGELAAVVSDIDDGAPLGRRRDLSAHHEVLRCLALTIDVAPMQFGIVLPDQETVRHDLFGTRPELLRDALDRVAGNVQMSARATYDETLILQEIVSTNPHVARLRERTRDLPPGQPHPDLIRLGELVTRDLEARRLADGGVLLDRLSPHVVLYRERTAGDPHLVLDVALLVERSRVGELEAELESLAETLFPRIRLRLTQPTAAFDFVEDSLWV